MAFATFEIIEGVESLWALPSGVEPKGLVMCLHGACHGAEDFFPATVPPSKAAGLPESMRISKALLTDGWGVLALSSAMRSHPQMWDSRGDAQSVVAAVACFRTQHRLTSAPLVALGISAGGALAMKLPRLMRIDALVVQIMAVSPHELKCQKGDAQYPPALFIHMARDGAGPIRCTSSPGGTGELVGACIAELRRRGIKASDVLARPLPITATFFSERIPRCQPHLSAAIQRVLKERGIIDEANMLIDDPRSNLSWMRALRASPEITSQLPGRQHGEADSLEADCSPVAEVLNAAYCQHEITADCMSQTLAWINTVV